MTKPKEDPFEFVPVDQDVLEVPSEEPFYWDNFPKNAWGKPSKAVIAMGPDGCGVVLSTAGPHVACDIEQISGDLGDLGLDDAPPGISIWEGKSEGGAYDHYNGDYADTYLVGTFREPTEEEWQAIRKGKCPWSDEEWINFKG